MEVSAYWFAGIQTSWSTARVWLASVKGGKLESVYVQVTFTCEESEAYYRKFADGDGLWIKDELVDKAKSITKQEVFSFDVFNETFCDYRPKGFSGNKLKKCLPNGIKLKTRVEDVVFTAEERTQIIERWNNDLGKSMASLSADIR